MSRFNLSAFSWRLTAPRPHRLRLSFSCRTGAAEDLVRAFRDREVYARVKHSGSLVVERPADLARALKVVGAGRSVCAAAERWAATWRHFSRGHRGSDVMRPAQEAAAAEVLRAVEEAEAERGAEDESLRA